MDPLSVTASILAVVGAGGTIAKGLHKLVSLKNTPLTLLQLNNEVSDLRLVVGAIEHLIHQYHLPTLSDQPNHQSLCNELQRAKVLILDLERLILYGLSKIGGDGNPKLDRVAWLRSETKVLRKKDRLRNNRINLSAALEILSSSTALRNELQLQKLQSQGHAMEALVREIIQYHQQSQVINPTSKAAEASPPPKPLGISISPVPLLESPSELHSPKVPAIATHTSAVQLILTLDRGCRPLCICSCHRQNHLETPRSLQRVLGSLFIGYSGLPMVFQKCDRANCMRASSTSTRIIYAFPRWLLARAVMTSIAYSDCKGPELVLRTMRVRSLRDHIFHTVQCDDFEHVKLLLSSGKASVLDVDNVYGATPLHYAARKRSFDIVKLLMCAGADMMFEDSAHETPLALLWGIILTSRDPEDKIALWRECLTGFVEANEFSEAHQSVLQLSSLSEENSIRKLPRYAIDDVDLSGRTPLSWAAQRGDLDAVQELLYRGADPNRADRAGKTPLHWSAEASGDSCLFALLQAGAAADVKDLRGREALFYSLLTADSVDRIETLAHYGANLKAIGEDRVSLLKVAVSNGLVESTRFMLQNGVDVNEKQDNNTDPALFCAIFCGRDEVLHILFGSGFDCSIKTKRGQSILFRLACYGSMECCNILEKKGLQVVDTEDQNKYCKTVMKIARWRLRHNVEWADWSRRPPDKSPSRWFTAFKALLASVVEQNHNSAPPTVTADSNPDNENFSSEGESETSGEEEVWHDAPDW